MSWAMHDCVMKLEFEDALEEFFAFHSRDKFNEHSEVYGLFFEWFLYDRPTTRELMTPAAVFYKREGRRFSAKERELLSLFQKTEFGIFEILAADPVKGEIRLYDFDRRKEWLIADIKGSRSAHIGDILFARVIPIKDKAQLTGWVTGYPAGESGLSAKLRDIRIKNPKAAPLTPRQVLRFFCQPVRWEEKGAFFCKTKLAALWQRYQPKEMTFAELEDAIAMGDFDGHIRGMTALQKAMPAIEDADNAGKIVAALWNLESGRKAGRKPPIEMEAEAPRGPVELKFIRKLTDTNMERLSSSGKVFTREEVKNWLNNTENGENGRSPFDLIAEERRAAGHPEPENILFSFSCETMERDASAVNNAAQWANQAPQLMTDGKFDEAALLLEKAWPELKLIDKSAFRVMGNLGVCYAFMGMRDKALDALRTALKYNPDYILARQHLASLESMNDRQYKEFIKAGNKRLKPTEWNP